MLSVNESSSYPTSTFHSTTNELLTWLRRWPSLLVHIFLCNWAIFSTSISLASTSVDRLSLTPLPEIWNRVTSSYDVWIAGVPDEGSSLRAITKFVRETGRGKNVLSSLAQTVTQLILSDEDSKSTSSGGNTYRITELYELERFISLTIWDFPESMPRHKHWIVLTIPLLSGILTGLVAILLEILCDQDLSKVVIASDGWEIPNDSSGQIHISTNFVLQEIGHSDLAWGISIQVGSFILCKFL